MTAATETEQQTAPPPRRLVAVGGGAQNRLWLQIVTDVGGLAQAVPERTVGAAFGDAFLAGLATGLVPDLGTLRRDWVRIATVLEPRPAEQAAYDPLYRVYRSLYEHAKDDREHATEAKQPLGRDHIAQANCRDDL